MVRRERCSFAASARFPGGSGRRVGDGEWERGFEDGVASRSLASSRCILLIARWMMREEEKPRKEPQTRARGSPARMCCTSSHIKHRLIRRVERVGPRHQHARSGARALVPARCCSVTSSAAAAAAADAQPTAPGARRRRRRRCAATNPKASCFYILSPLLLASVMVWTGRAAIGVAIDVACRAPHSHAAASPSRRRRLVLVERSRQTFTP